MKCIQNEFTYFRVACDCLSCSESVHLCRHGSHYGENRLTSIRVYPSWTQRQCLDAILGQLYTELGGDDVHAGLANGISQQGSHASDTSELDVSTLTGNEHDLLLFAGTNEIEEAVDNVDVADQVCFNLCAVSFYGLSLSGTSYRVIHTLSLISFSSASNLP
jgi:hypothetical protein